MAADASDAQRLAPAIRASARPRPAVAVAHEANRVANERLNAIEVGMRKLGWFDKARRSADESSNREDALIAGMSGRYETIDEWCAAQSAVMS